MSTQSNNSPVSRADAIASGALVDLSAQLPAIVERFFTLPVACTKAVYEMLENAAQENAATDLANIAGYVLALAHVGIQVEDALHPGSSTAPFRVPIKNDASQLITHQLKIHCGPGDDLEPVYTVMLVDEEIV
jgi:hypothetical protein